MIEDVNYGSGSYLFACFGGELICSPDTVFSRISDETLIPSLISLLDKEYGGEGNLSFHAQPIADVEEADQIRLDKAIVDLATYDDPDPGVYDPPPSRQTMLRAFYAQRAELWTEMLLSKRAKTAIRRNDTPGIAQMRRLHQCLVKIDYGIMSLGAKLLRLRQADPHGLISEPTRTGATFDQITELQARIDKWTSPILEAAHEAEASCVGVSRLIGSFIDESVRWETDLRESLRHLCDVLAALPHSHGAESDESQIVSLGAALYAQGTRLQDGLATLEACEQDTDDSLADPQPNERAEDSVRTAFGSDQQGVVDTIQEALAALEHTAEKHRLIFLFFARPKRRNPSNRNDPWDQMPDRHLPDERIPHDKIDASGEFLFVHCRVLEQFAQEATSRYGPGVGTKPTMMAADGRFVEVEGGSLPCWSIPDCASELEDSSDALNVVCKRLARLDTEGCFRSLIKEVQSIVHDEGASRWYSSVLVNWDYLSKLDTVIGRIKSAELEWIQASDSSKGAAPCKAAPDQPDSLQSGGVKVEDKDSDQTAVRQLTSALQELRRATGELLHDSETVDIYPQPEIETYHQALRDAKSRVDGISAHLAYGREKPGQIETDIRETLHKLSSAVEHVASDYNDRPGAYPLPKEITAPGWEALKGLMPLEMVLAMTTMKPGDLEMPVEDRRVSGLILLMLLAQAYYKMLECVISMASWCSALDVELNQSYLWVTSSLTNLLKNHEDLEDFPVEFKPIFDDLYPSTVRDLDWEDMVAPEAERFLSTVQRYVHEKGVYEPDEGSTGGAFVQLFRPSVDTAISRALDYHKRMHQHAQKAFGGVSVGGSIQAGGAINAAGEIKAGGDIPSGGDVRSGSQPPGTPSAKPSGKSVAADPILFKDNKYEWARQSELVRATDQVLGQGTLSPGVLSRACGHQIDTNGKRGQGSRVKVSSFLPWIARKFNLAKDEQTQIRNAIIGEINERNS